ncbi:MAG: GAF domain-containing protein [Deltaproteobacteria bacterium]|nr:GAF domain-containing protein [Deltaproteobacteria bacterium]
MAGNKRLLEVLIAINTISNTRTLKFDQKLQHILIEIVKCMQAQSGSIMLMKGLKKLEVVASTNPSLIGIRQSLDQKSPSAWVVKHKIPLYMKDEEYLDVPLKRFDHYEKDAFLLVPIISNGKVIGVLSVTDKIGEDVFSREEHAVLLNIASQVIITVENQRLTESLQIKRRAIQRKNKELVKLEKLKTELFNMIVHDLKGAISEIIANLDILTYTASEENQEFVDSAKTGCDALYRMVFDLLDIARLEDRRIELVYEKINPQDLIKESLSRLFGLFRIKELEFVEVIPSSGKPEHFRGDRGMLLRILQNLLINAMNHSPIGEKIEIGYKNEAHDKITFFVKDNGPGVPEEYKKAIFDKYFQLEKKNDGRVYTTGLGLTFCKMAVEAHRGRIGVESRYGKESRFLFTLPLE